MTGAAQSSDGAMPERPKGLPINIWEYPGFPDLTACEFRLAETVA